MPEFTAVLEEDGTWSVILDGEQQYTNLTTEALKEFIDDFVASNTEAVEE